MNEQHPKLWWYRLAEKIMPGRCREIPKADDPSVVLLRQVALIKKRCYLQQFASGESPDSFHSHPWRGGTIAIGLSGAVWEEQALGYWSHKRHRAPYLHIMGPNHVHVSTEPTPGHTSIFIGLGQKTDNKGYWPKGQVQNKPMHWTKVIKKKVKRI